MDKKKVSDSITTLTELVLPNDTNPLGNLRGGRLLHWMDVAAAIAAQKHCNSITVTAAVDNVSFRNPIHVGNVVTIKAQITRTFRTSMEVFLEVWADNFLEKNQVKANEAFFTFVALNKAGTPIEIPTLEPESDREMKLFEGALRRRELRLILANRMKPEDADNLKDLFTAHSEPE